jgi:hypothetical protein
MAPDETLREAAIIDGCPMCTLEFEHEGPCVWFCSWCTGTGECPDCDGDGEDGSGLPGTCMECGGGGACPQGCYEGSVIDDGP